MSEPRFTPGPWVVEEESGLIEIVAHYSPRGPDGGPSIVAEVCDDGEERGTTLADARLLAAAPDMHAALKRVEAHLADACDNGVQDLKPEAPLLRIVRAALEKAVAP